MKQYDVVIIGAGAAGLMCALTAGQRGRSVLLLDSSNKAGKKILMSGGGRCNFTNLYVTYENFISHNPQFCRSALSRYTPSDFISLVKRHHIGFHEKEKGQLFCNNKSKDILSMLLKEARDAQVTIELNTDVTEISKQLNHQFLIKSKGQSVLCQSLVVATGGLSIPTLGSSPFGYQIAKQFDIPVFPTRAGLVPFTLHDADKNYLSQLSGVSQDCVVSFENAQFHDHLLFTHRGLSGPAMLQISSYWEPGQFISVDLCPEQDMIALLQNLQSQSAKSKVKNGLLPYFPKRLIELWLDDAIQHKFFADLSHADIVQIVDSFKQWKIRPNATEGYRTAEVTLGGVDCNALSSKTFESRDVKGLYFIGEVLDVSGWLGGYNFQWAWSSGVAAGEVV